MLWAVTTGAGRTLATGANTGAGANSGKLGSAKPTDKMESSAMNWNRSQNFNDED